MFESRTQTECKVYCLSLNSIFANAEQASIVAVATSERTLKSYYESQFLPETEVAGGYRYSFCEGPLRNCNPLDEWRHVAANVMGWGQGWGEVWVVDPITEIDDCHRVDF